jgi:uncharacterized membrane protein
VRSSMAGLWAAAGVYRFRESLFLLPALLVLAGVALAEATAAVDQALGASVPWTLAMSSNAAVWLLATVAGATITTAGVVLSLTVVSLQLASSQFSPRVMRSFIRDRLSQTVIGSLAATFVYCVLPLRHVSGEPDAPAPRVALTVAVALIVVTVLLIVAHLDHLSRGLQVGEVVRSIAEEGEDVLAGMSRPSVRSRPVATVSGAGDRFTFAIAAPRDGWVTRAVSERILAAVPAGTTVRPETRVGAYIHRGEGPGCPHPDAHPSRQGDTAAVCHRADRQHPNHAGGSRLRHPPAGRRRAAGTEPGHQRPHHRRRSRPPAGVAAA